MAEASRAPDPTKASPLAAWVLLGVQRGEPEALAALFEACFDDLYGLAMHLTGHRSQAEDIVQEVFLRLHKAAGTLDPARDPRPWLRTVTANLCRDQWRSFGAKVARKSESVDQDQEKGPVLTNGTPGPDDVLAQQQSAELVQAALLKLPDKLREVVVLRDYQDLSHEEIAEIVGASPVAVRKRYSRALDALGQLLQDVMP
jgi:RNA polymerase sigma-70 factor (ECF subfamily)